MITAFCNEMVTEKIPMQDILRNLKETKHSLVLH